MTSESLTRTALTLTVIVISLMTLGCQGVYEVSASASAQGPTMTQCKLWDEAVLAIFHAAVLASIAVPPLLAPLLGLLGRRYWIFTSPRRRLIIVTLILAILLILAVPVAPWIAGLGWGWYSGVDPMYFYCTDQSFGADGLLWGLVFPGQAAISQWPMMIGLIIAGSLVGLVLGLVIQLVLARLTGIRRKI